MRSDPNDYEIVAPKTLGETLALLAKEPGAWTPIAGGTDLMVQYAAGKLAAHKLVSIWNLPELRQIEVSPNEIAIGAACSYTELRGHDVIAREFPLLATAARWVGGIANQNRGTLGGNIVNASPAADSLPSLLAYQAELVLTSFRGDRRVSYMKFHSVYKKMDLAPGELVRAICLPRRYADYFSYTRKVGTRNAQAISKVCIAALGRLVDGVASDVRIALGSVAPIPLRLVATEKLVDHKTIDAGLIAAARKSAAAEIQPIDDIRSTAKYRAAVTGNLVADLLTALARSGSNSLIALRRWNQLSRDEAQRAILPCCGSQAWAHAMALQRPVMDEAAICAASDDIWRSLKESGWTEAFDSHPRIGETRAAPSATRQSTDWSAQEQQKVAQSDDAIKQALAEANRDYERKFGRIFIVCATGKTAAEILKICRQRMTNDTATEMREAAEQQRQITQLRLKKWLES
jgi:OHCU decarboxylase